MSYATIADIRARGITAPADQVVQDALDMASELIDAYTGTSFDNIGILTKTFYDQRTRIVPLPLPISLITDVTVSGYDLSTGQWELDGQTLRLFPFYMRDGSGFPLIGGGDFARWAYDSGRSAYGYDVSVTGTWGWPSIPASVKQACILIATDQLNPSGAGAGLDSDVRTLSVEGFSVGLADTATTGATTGNRTANRLLNPYRATSSGIL